MKPKKVRKFESINFELETDDSSIEDDVDKDPDWRKTPFYNRIKSLLVIGKTFIFIVYSFNLK